MESLTSPFGTFQLQRLPLRAKETLRAWDAADEYLLGTLAEQFGHSLPESPLIINDSFGALALALHKSEPVLWSKSWLSHAALQHNGQLNNIDISVVTLLPSTSRPAPNPALVIMKLPHNTCLLEEQLLILQDILVEGSVVIAADMAKNIHTSTLELFERCLGKTRTSLAKKKARLIFTTVDKSLPAIPFAYPRTIEHHGLKLVNYAGVFSRQKIDIGTRFFLEHLSDLHQQKGDVIDLGCGNGALGLFLAKHNNQIRLTFVDESFMAVQAAKESWLANKLDDRAKFVVNDCLTGFAPDSADVVICNPPFHQGNTIGDHIAWRMFQQSHGVLRKGGELRIIGNRHLGYHGKLKCLFGRCTTVASNSKFVVLSARKS